VHACVCVCVCACVRAHARVYVHVKGKVYYQSHNHVFIKKKNSAQVIACKCDVLDSNFSKEISGGV